MPRRDTSVKTKLFSNGVCIRKFSRMKSGRPEANIQHFFERPVEDTLVGVVIPIYNEEATDLRKTLLSIDLQVNYMKARKMEITPHIMLVQDGVGKASSSMKKYLRNMFNLDENQWKREFEVEDKSAPYQTFILQIINNSRVSFVDVNAGYKENSPDNRKKHNSHEWFLGESGFINYYRPKYSFCTDCSTLFDKACLLQLIQLHMEKNPKCSVSTGRQRVMTKEMQGDPDESLFSIASVLRHAQRFDYEASFVCYTGTFSAVGFLPVVPGPCGLYRTDVLIPSKDNGGYTDSPCEWYFDVVNTDPDKSGLVLGNLRIAEDRVLSYSVVLKAKTASEMGLVPKAVFYFEAETSLKSLVLQRRRWINGTWAGYWYLGIQHPNLIFNSTCLSLFVKTFVWFLLLCQLAIYFVVALSPAIFLGALRLALSNLAADTDGFLALAFWVILVLMYLYFIYYHHTHTYLGYLFNIWLIFSAVLSMSSIASFIVYVVKNNRLLHPNILKTGDFSNSDFTDALTIWVVLTIFALPLIIAIIADGHKSIILMLRSIIPYYMVLPMVVGFFAAYSFSRCWDLTWGNRPSEDDPAHRQAVDKQEEIKIQSATLAAFIAIVNIFFFFTQELIFGYTGGKLYIVLAIFATTLFQMIVGLLWFSLWRVRVFFRGVWHFLTHWKRQKKFIYKTYGEEELEEMPDVDVHTLYYNDNNDDSDDEIDDFINDDDEVEDYYDADSRAIVLVDGPLQRHMSVSQFTLPSIPEDDSPSSSSPITIYEGAKPAKFIIAPIVIPSSGTNSKPPSPSYRGETSPSSVTINMGNSSPRSILNTTRIPISSHPTSSLRSSDTFSRPNTTHTLSMDPIVSRKGISLGGETNLYNNNNYPARPPLARSANSAWGVSFASHPVVISPLLTSSNPPVSPPLSLALSPPLIPTPVVSRAHHVRIRSSSMPPLFNIPPPNSPPPPSALRQSNNKN